MYLFSLWPKCMYALGTCIYSTSLLQMRHCSNVLFINYLLRFIINHYITKIKSNGGTSYLRKETFLGCFFFFLDLSAHIEWRPTERSRFSYPGYCSMWSLEHVVCNCNRGQVCTRSSDKTGCLKPRMPRLVPTPGELTSCPSHKTHLSFRSFKS